MTFSSLSVRLQVGHISLGLTVLMLLAATHFPALKSYALTRECILAASMLFDPQTRKPFILAYDQVGASQALHVAREHCLPQNIIDRAEQYLLQYGQETSDILYRYRLNVLASQRKNENELDKLSLKRKKAYIALQETKERMKKERGQLYEEMRAKARDLMQDWKEGRADHRMLGN